LVIKSIHFALNDQVTALLEKGWADTDARVRYAAVLTLLSPPEALAKRRAALVKNARRALRYETDPSVKLLRDQLN
jgi:hypothetical protein